MPENRFVGKRKGTGVLMRYETVRFLHTHEENICLQQTNAIAPLDFIAIQAMLNGIVLLLPAISMSPLFQAKLRTQGRSTG